MLYTKDGFIIFGIYYNTGICVLLGSGVQYSEKKESFGIYYNTGICVLLGSGVQYSEKKESFAMFGEKLSKNHA